MALLESEHKAKIFVEKIGISRAYRLLELITSRIQRRIDNANKEVIGQFFDDSCIKKAQWEIDLIFVLKMGITLIDDYFSPINARKRIEQRIKARKQSRIKDTGNSVAENPKRVTIALSTN